MGVCGSVVLVYRRSGATSSSIGVCGSVVLVYGRSGAISSSMRVCGSVVLVYRRLGLRRSLSWGFVLPLSGGGKNE